LDSATRTRLHDVTLQARQLLVNETQQILEGVYGLHRSGFFEPASNLPAVQTLPEVRQTRMRLEKYLADERAAGLKPDEAHNKLVKEVAFTWLNRLIAFKMMEARRLVRGTLDRYHDSNAFKFYLSDHPEELALFNAGDSPRDALGEGPRDVAYRRFLLDQCARMAAQIRVLFDPDNLPSRLFPRPRALRDLIVLLNEPALSEAWQPGNEETIGWVYQYFNEPDLEIFRSASAPKVPPHLIAARTQQFTPRWIVTYLVQNTLGRLWVQMHPDTRLAEGWKYLVPVEGAPREPLKRAKDIEVLDPAAGTMHFGLVAFDLLAEMYTEELERAGEPGWPTVPSVQDKADIAASIIEHNLFGIDIDLRAVQLSALALFLKAKSLNPVARIRQSNLASGDVLLLNGSRLDAFLDAMKFTRPVYSKVIRALWSRLKEANQVGSLLRVEHDIARLIEQEKKAKAADLPMFPDVERFGDAYEGGEEFWEVLGAQIVQAFDEFARQQAAQGRDETYFTGEATKGMKLLEVMMRRYDVVVTNPPYLDARDYNPTLKTTIEGLYPEGKRNLYAAFQIRCLEFLKPGGRLGMISPQTFMFITNFEKTREVIRSQAAIESLVHTGLNTFPDAVVDCAFYVLRREPNARLRDDSVGTYFRLVKEPDAEAKRRGFECALSNMVAGEADKRVYRYRQGDFDAIPGAPWVYWITPGLRELFRTLPKLEDISQPRVGLQTGDNFRFLRYWWEVGLGKVGRGCLDASAARRSGKRWFPYMKGGSFRRWWGNQEYVLNWGNDGEELWAFTPTAVIRNPGFYFRPGVTWTDLTSGRFSARLSPGGFIFDVSGSSVFPTDVPLILAVMNSSFAQYALKLVNPTVHVQVGDLARLPIPTASSPTLNALVEEAIALARADSEEDETTYDFIAPPDWRTGLADVAARKARLAEVERQIDEEVYRLYGISPEDRAAIEEEVGSEEVVGDGWLVDGDERAAASDEEGAKETLDTAEDQPPTTNHQTLATLARRWVSYAVGLALGRFAPGEEGGLGRGRFSPEVAQRLRALA
jgi:hypothetical protein